MIIRNYLFHRVENTKNSWAPAMNMNIFKKCIKYISTNFEVCTIESLLLDEKYKKRTNKEYACITFDDGFKDNIKNAIPILEEYDIKASFYITTDCIDKNEVTWTHSLPYSFAVTKKNSLSLDYDFVPLPLRLQYFNNREDRILFGKKLYEFLKSISYEDTTTLVKSVYKQFDDVTPLKEYMMDWDDIRKIRDKGHEIGSHTKSHPFLAQIKSDDLLRNEFVYSLNRIENECGIKPRSISYPVGNYDFRVKKIAKECGYQLGLAVNQKFHEITSNDLFEVPRMDIYADNGWIKTYLHLTGHLEAIKRVLRK